MSRINEGQPPHAELEASYRGGGGFWTGWITFAGTIMVMLGAFHAIQGLVAIFKDDYFLVGKSGLVVNVDYAAWGWLHLILGVIVAIAGVSVVAGRVWARIVGVTLALTSAVVNVAFLAAYPLWSVMMIALDVTVILALTVHGGDVREETKV
jgi:hypothetical protein